MLTDFMQFAVDQAKLAGVATYQNPRVGAVLVKDGHVLAQGYHHYFGGDHAEVDVLRQVTPEQARGATLFVTLEPCSHYGKTPPCCEQLVAAGIQQVVIGQLDPHPLVGGQGRQYLRDHGVKVITGCMSDVVRKLNPHYNHFYTQQRPWVTLKTAMTLDGKINSGAPRRTLISNHASYVDSQRLRSQFQAILIGERTLTIDDPQLTVRLIAMSQPPVRLVVLESSTVALQHRLVRDGQAPTWLLCRHAAASDEQLQASANVHVLIGDWSPAAISQLCVEQGWQSLLVEGGAHIQAGFVAAALVDEWISYLAPTMIGGAGLPAVTGAPATESLVFERPELAWLGTDLRLRAVRKEGE
ncbi:bifunctional diaminohydroxyphosphoribosylaminopyrimidine deaminase/5-amino-6-(5-phosphoribosylamino)uracil reductase RibD [Lactiplantibacillus paraplantarum]|uniref:bifunctional diaminohydroxyphosphoribosylaminopyrimidine deaminase/5-amino-6-(5-phosphoribosylamino)uracil reductase RibD n=1 Tax=Lactiplantibacillus paraplantarum TaxID=60520 RepID=UPI003DA49043